MTRTSLKPKQSEEGAREEEASTLASLQETDLEGQLREEEVERPYPLVTKGNS